MSCIPASGGGFVKLFFRFISSRQEKVIMKI